MRKLKRPTDQRLALLRNLATNLLWHGKIETTVEKAKELRSYAEKLLTLAINTHEDTVKATKRVVDEKGVVTHVEVINDGPKKLAARRKIMSKLYTIGETQLENESKAAFVERTKDIKHPLIEKIFNELAPKYAKRKQELGTGGGYTRILRLDTRKGDAAEIAIIELV